MECIYNTSIQPNRLLFVLINFENAHVLQDEPRIVIWSVHTCIPVMNILKCLSEISKEKDLGYRMGVFLVVHGSLCFLSPQERCRQFCESAKEEEEASQGSAEDHERKENSASLYYMWKGGLPNRSWTV